MTREIKFRAWDNKCNEWYGESNEQSLTFVGFHLFGECTMLCTPSVSYLEHLIIEQFTGLKDKNGTEIYEGDILTSVSRPKDKPPLVIAWDDFRMGWTYFHPRKAYEIIGNIHEELLK